MLVRDIMTESIACCSSDTNLKDVARMMVEHDCGAIPVVESMQNKRLIGMITDRDIVCRCVAKGQNPLDKTAGDYMTPQIACVEPDTDLSECERIMEEHKVRRVPVVNEDRACCGIVSQADIALHASEHEAAEVLREVSQPVHA